MELFVVNRHTEDDAETKASKSSAEQKLLAKVQKKIERNKALRTKRKEKDVQKKELKEKAIAYRYERKLEKLAKQSKIIAIPTTAPEEYIKDHENIEEESTKVNKRKLAKIKLKELEKSAIETVGYTVLGGENFGKKAKVERVLPKWLTNPTTISLDLQNLNTKVSSQKQLDKSIRKKLKANGIEYLFPVQAQVIPYILESNAHASVVFPRDVCVSAPTGSGKTLAFALPVIQLLQRYTIRQVRALVILPTQDLALQVYRCFRDYVDESRLVVALAVGKSNIEQEQRMLVSHTEAYGYQSRADILICTAGRLVDHIKYTRGFNLKHLDFLIIDEADRVLDSVQTDWLFHLEQHIYENNHPSKVLNLNTLAEKRPPQKLLFSATLSQDPEKLEKLSLFQPKLFSSLIESNDTETITENGFVGKYATPKELSEKYILADIAVKPLVIYKFILAENLTKTIIFANSIENVHRLTVLLKSLFQGKKHIDEISSNLSPEARKVLIRKFSDGTIDVLICTDALTRGIDLPGVKCVISYSAPKYIEAYIHRVGRTARAGEKGLAVTMTDRNELARLRKTLTDVGKTSPEEIEVLQEDLEPLEKQYRKALNDLKSIVTGEDATSLIKVKKSKQIFRKRKETAAAFNGVNTKKTNMKYHKVNHMKH